MQIKDIIRHLEQLAPPMHQESYDNARLITGNPNWELKGVLTSLDCLEVTVEEAWAKECNLIVAHHPIVFKGLKSITGRNYVERTIIKAIKKDIAIYAIHTNLDAMLYKGVNSRICDRLGLKNRRVLAPKYELDYIKVRGDEAKIMTALGTLGDVELVFGNGEYQVAFPAPMRQKVYGLLQKQGDGIIITPSPFFMPEFRKRDLHHVGSGMIGELADEQDETVFLADLFEQMQTPVIRHTALLGKPIRKVAICGGAGSFLLPHAIRAGADIFITADYKYHEFFDADGQIVIADIGHYESEQFTIELLAELVSEKFPNFAVRSTELTTNPVRYFVKS